MAPFFTIFSASRNAGAYARRSIESVLAQSEASWQLLFVDDASEDDTLAQATEASHGDSRISVYHNDERLWKLDNFMRLLPDFSGDVIVELDGDDWLSSSESLSIIRSAYDSSSLVEATAGSFIAYPNGKYVCAKTQPCVGFRLMQGGFCDSVPAPRTWRRHLTERSLAELPELYIDPTTGRYWRTNADIALYAPALFWAKEIAAIEEPILTVNWQTTQHDDMLEPTLMRDEGERLYAWCYQREWQESASARAVMEKR